MLPKVTQKSEEVCVKKRCKIRPLWILHKIYAITPKLLQEFGVRLQMREDRQHGYYMLGSIIVQFKYLASANNPVCSLSNAHHGRT